MTLEEANERQERLRDLDAKNKSTYAEAIESIKAFSEAIRNLPYPPWNIHPRRNKL